MICKTFRRPLLVAALLCWQSLPGAAQTLSRKTNFDENWSFHLGNSADPSRDFGYGSTTIFAKTGAARGTAIDPRFKDTGWRRLDLPHDWAVELPFVHSENSNVMAHGYKPVGGLFPETSIGWYRKHFMVSRKDSGQRFQIQFDGVFRDASFWINGFYLGNHKSGYVGVAYDITDYLNYDKENVLVVRVDATQYEGWFYEGAGIYRHVWLNTYNNLHIADNGLFTSTTLKGKLATVRVETTLQNQNLFASKATVQTYLVDRGGKRLAFSPPQQLAVEAQGTGSLTQQLVMPAAHLWSLEDPYLYRVVCVVKQQGKTVDSLGQRLGIRGIAIRENGVFLNGKHLKIQGTNNHQDHAGLGSALPDYLQYYRVRLLKEMGCNAIRTSHNPPSPELLDACDSLGMLVLDENRLLNSSPQYLEDFRQLLLRDRSRTSVFLWSIGNEEGWVQTQDVGRRIAQSLLALQQKLDPTRTSTYAADLANVFHGINQVIPVRGFNYRHTAVEAYHRDHPSQPIIGTEMASTVSTRGIYAKDTLRAYVPDQDITAPSWGSTAEAWWTLAGPHDYWLGGFVWTGFDYRGEPTPYQWPNVNSHFGIMDVCGFPKNIYYYYQSWWTDKDVLHLSPHWNWKGKEGQDIDVWVNSNADQVELFLNGKSRGKKEMPRNGHLQWSLPYAPGTLEAVGYKKGKKLTAKVETTEAPAEVVVTPYKTTMLADGRDATVINISTVDRKGREVPDAANLIHFSLKGDARIIGVGNGDPSSHEQDRYFDTAAQRQLFNGKCQVILLAGKNPGTVKFEASSPGLWTGSTDIITVAPSRPAAAAQVAPGKKKETGKILGADVSFLPELEARGLKFSDKGKQEDALELLKDHGFNYVRLRIFNQPAADSGYSPRKGFCDLEHTKQMARRIKAAGMKFLLDFHYSDYWADPGKQYKPSAWKGLDFSRLKDSVYQFTRRVLSQLKEQGTLPDMVQVGNEINHGMLWPEGSVSHLDSLAELFKAGTRAVTSVDPAIIIMLHIALGGQNDESVFFINSLLERGANFDVIGESYYPKWHGTLSDLQNNLQDLSRRYQKDVIVVEYSQLKKEVNDIVFGLPDNRGKGSFIWEPLNTWEAVFDRNGAANSYLSLYDTLSRTYLNKK
ncbi:MAG: beta-galactosidase GalA [Flavisolibacter sp.]